MPRKFSDESLDELRARYLAMEVLAAWSTEYQRFGGSSAFV
jgi:hypothetical protein